MSRIRVHRVGVGGDAGDFVVGASFVIGFGLPDWTYGSLRRGTGGGK